MVTGYRGHRQTLLSVGEISLQVCTLLNLAEINQFTRQLNQGHVKAKALFEYSTRRAKP